MPEPALDALTLFGEILTVAVFDAEFFDDAAGDLVDINDEGTVADGLAPFDEPTVKNLVSSRRIAPAGAGGLHWHGQGIPASVDLWTYGKRLDTQ
jgi:hypothetical protein